MKFEREPITFLTTVNFGRLPNKPVSRFGIGVLTPSVSNCEYWICGGTVVSITNFKDGSDGQNLHILGDGNTTIVNNANIITNTGANKLLTNNKIYRFTYLNKTWIEDA